MTINLEQLHQIINEKLQPIVKQVDEQAMYAEDYIFTLAEAGFFDSTGKDMPTLLKDEATIVRETAKVCMTTAFCVWCHLAALTYLRHTDNPYLRETILPQIEQGAFLGATGLSNPMKYYSGLEKLQLTATKTTDGYLINGTLPAVSNLGQRHYFGAVAALEDREVMVLVSTKTDRLTLQEKVGFIGVNGSGTYSCTFDNVFIPNEQVIAEEAKVFCDKIRPTFIYYQIPLGVGVIASALEGVEKVKAKQNGSNEYLQIQACDLEAIYEELLQGLDGAADQLSLQTVVPLRLQSVENTLVAVQANMLHNGGGGYVQGSVPSRNLREAYFFANLTPTVRHLHKLQAIL